MSVKVFLYVGLLNNGQECGTYITIHYTLHITHYMSPGPVMDAVTSPLSSSPLRPPHYIFLLELETNVREVFTITVKSGYYHNQSAHNLRPLHQQPDFTYTYHGLTSLA